jgi:peroxiredoxin
MAEQAAIGQTAPDFELTDVQGNTVRLSDYRDKKHVLLVFTRGFT